MLLSDFILFCHNTKWLKTWRNPFHVDWTHEAGSKIKIWLSGCLVCQNVTTSSDASWRRKHEIPLARESFYIYVQLPMFMPVLMQRRMLILTCKQMHQYLWEKSVSGICGRGEDQKPSSIRPMSPARVRYGKWFHIFICFCSSSSWKWLCSSTQEVKSEEPNTTMLIQAQVRQTPRLADPKDFWSSDHTLIDLLLETVFLTSQNIGWTEKLRIITWYQLPGSRVSEFHCCYVPVPTLLSFHSNWPDSSSLRRVFLIVYFQDGWFLFDFFLYFIELLSSDP